MGALRGENKDNTTSCWKRFRNTAFFATVPEENPSPTGGWEKRVVFEDFEGVDPVSLSRSVHRLRYMGPTAVRPNDQYFAAQQPGVRISTLGGGWAFPSTAAISDVVDDVALIARDSRGRYHARWIPKADIKYLPQGLQEAVAKTRTGIWKVTTQPALKFDPEDQSEDHTQHLVSKIVALLRQEHNVLLYGPPATGKTGSIQPVRRAFSRPAVTIDTGAEKVPLAETGNVSCPLGPHSTKVTHMRTLLDWPQTREWG